MVNDPKGDAYGDRHIRTDPSGDRRVTIGPVSFVVSDAAAWADGLARVGVEIERHPKRLHDSDAAALAEVESALREMHDALSAHFAPVLKWSEARLTRLTATRYQIANGIATSSGWDVSAR